MKINKPNKFPNAVSTGSQNQQMEQEKQFLTGMNAHALAASAPDQQINVNTPQEWQQLTHG